MRASLFDLSRLHSHAQFFAEAAAKIGFPSVGEIERFLFKGYGKAIHKIPPADRPRGALFFLKPPGVVSQLAPAGEPRPVLLQIQSDVAQCLYAVPADLAGGIQKVEELNIAAKQRMAAGAWSISEAQRLSRESGECVVWGNGVSATVFLAGYSLSDSPDVVEELPSGLPTSFQSLSWSDGEIFYEFAGSELNDTTETGIWRLPDQFLLRPKPEKIMSIGLGRFLRQRMAGYRHHEDEPYVENEGRADISLVRYNGEIYIIEVKWVGSSLIARKQAESDDKIKAALKSDSKGWVTNYDDSTFGAGTRQLAKYFGTQKYQRAYLTVFDCSKPRAGHGHEQIPVDPANVVPFDSARFRVYRACVDPRKASKSSKTPKK